MKTCGIIAEYNPFHNGHKRHLEQARLQTGAEKVVVVMSGNFVQRGEPAVCGKFKRAEMALRNGADIVIELPVLFATASAEYFAMAAVKLLDDIGVDFINFGSENGDIEYLGKAADAVMNETAEFKQLLKDGLGKGLSFPKARGEALKAAGAAIFEPNDILGVEYLKALKILGSGIKPTASKRDKNDAHYHSTEIAGDIASATAIRKMLMKYEARGKKAAETRSKIMQVMPQSAAELLFGEVDAGRWNYADRYGDILRYAFAMMSEEQLREIADMGEGLENRIISAVKDSGCITDIAMAVKSKRYTLSRIYRVLFRTILNIRQSELEYYAATGFSRYARVLGFRKDAVGLLGKICDSSKIPVVTNVKKAMKGMDNPSLTMLEKDLLATRVYNAPLLIGAMIEPELGTAMVMV